jgi:hypothetical protein
MRQHISVRGSIWSPLSSRLVLTAFVSLLAVAAVACSSSNKPSTTRSTSTTAGGSLPTTSAPPSSGSDTGLSGKWSGQYSGAFTGTFTLTWQQSESKLSGTIHLSSGQSPHINGSVNGNTIRFGTVGSTAITYSGMVSGNSMSGTYKVQTSNGSVGGQWSATRA